MNEIHNLSEDGVYSFFASSMWFVLVDEHRAAYKSLLQLIEDNEALKTHLIGLDKDMRERAGEDELLNKIVEKADDHSEARPNIFIAARVIQIGQAFQIFSRQAMVVISSFFEQIVNDFFEAIFNRYPARMYDYLIFSPENSLRGKIDLSEVMDSSSMKELIYSLSRRAANEASNGSFDQIVRNLLKVSKNEIDESLIRSLEPRVLLRHKIVHEFHEEHIAPEEVIKSFEILFDAIRHFEDVAVAMDIDVDPIDS